MLALFPGFDDIEKFIYNSFHIQMQGNKFCFALGFIQKSYKRWCKKEALKLGIKLIYIPAFRTSDYGIFL